MKKAIVAMLFVVSAPVFADGLAADLLAGQKYFGVAFGFANNLPSDMITPGTSGGSFWRLQGGSVAQSGIGVELAYTDYMTGHYTMAYGSDTHIVSVEVAGTYLVKDFWGMDWTPKLGIASNNTELTISYDGGGKLKKQARKLGLTVGTEMHMGNWVLSFDQNTAGGGGLGLGYQKKF